MGYVKSFGSRIVFKAGKMRVSQGNRTVSGLDYINRWDING